MKHIFELRMKDQIEERSSQLLYATTLPRILRMNHERLIQILNWNKKRLPFLHPLANLTSNLQTRRYFFCVFQASWGKREAKFKELTQ